MDKEKIVCRMFSAQMKVSHSKQKLDAAKVGCTMTLIIISKGVADKSVLL